MDFVKRHLSYIKKAIVFILGAWGFGLGSAMFMYWIAEKYPESLKCEEIPLGHELFVDFSSSFFKLFIVVYILFTRLPEKVRKAQFLLRFLYFLLFYLFCCLIYFWI